MVDQIRQPNVGGILRNALAVQAFQDNRQTNSLRRNLLEAQLGDREAISGLSAQALGGDETALRGLAARAPQRATNILQFQGQLSDQQKEQVRGRREAFGRGVAFVERQPEEDRPLAYRAVVQDLTEQGLLPKGAPSQYSPEILDQVKTQLLDVDKLLEPPKPATTKQAFDTGTQTPVFATEEEIAASGGRLTPVPTGMKFESDGAGGFSLVTGTAAAGSGGLTKPVQTKTQEKILNAGETLARIDQMQEAFKPEFLEIGTRLKLAGAETREKAGIPLSEDLKRQLVDFSKFKRASLENTNIILKEMSGSAINADEGVRLRAALPNPGEGIFDGDSATVFKAKMDDVQASLKAAMKRHAFALANGLDPIELSRRVPLDEVDEFVSGSGGEQPPQRLRFDAQGNPIQ